MTSAKRPRRSEAGQAMIEFVLILPLLCILLFGMIDFSKALMYWNDLNQIAGEGARMAAVNRDVGSLSLQEYLEQQADTAELRDDITVSICLPEGAVAGGSVRVEAATPYTWLAAVTNLVGVDPITITGTATMRLEVTPTNFSADC